MYDTKEKSDRKLNLAVYRDKVLGCWTGKNIGGTLGGPFEGRRAMNDATFYVQDLGGKPAPNDDLDLQLVWLLAAEENGLENIDERLLGEYWLAHITGPWNEYGVCKANIRNGLIPPLSGSCNNERWKFSNGAWIRSEIWACLFPGSPDEASMYAYYDSCCDHCGEGIYAEVFTASMESMAFIVSDVREIIRYGLSRIPAESRVARAVKVACDCYDKKIDFKAAREAIVKDSEDLGWFQAPGNLGFVILGLLYGEGDFGKSVALANNCGDDTDCTAGTVGALLGIMMGRSGLPKEWIEPIGESIQTCSIETYGRNNILEFPKTLDELTDRVLAVAVEAQRRNGTLVRLVEQESCIPQSYLEKLNDNAAVVRRVWKRSPYEMKFDFPFGQLRVEYENGPYVTPGEPILLTFRISGVRAIEQIVSVNLDLPEGWLADPSDEFILNAKASSLVKGSLSVTPDDFEGAYAWLPITLTLADRFTPYPVLIPFQKKGCVNHWPDEADQDFWDRKNAMISR